MIVTGAAGGVGSVAVALLSKLGFQVIASTGGPAEADYLRALGASEIISYLRRSFIEFANTERQVNALNVQIRSLGQGEKFTAEAVRELIGAISSQYGIVDDELVPAMNRLVLGLGDVEAAQRALEIPARFAANGFGD